MLLDTLNAYYRVKWSNMFPDSPPPVTVFKFLGRINKFFYDFDWWQESLLEECLEAEFLDAQDIHLVLHVYGTMHNLKSAFCELDEDLREIKIQKRFRRMIDVALKKIEKMQVWWEEVYQNVQRNVTLLATLSPTEQCAKEIPYCIDTSVIFKNHHIWYS